MAKIDKNNNRIWYGLNESGEVIPVRAISGTIFGSGTKFYISGNENAKIDVSGNKCQLIIDSETGYIINLRLNNQGQII